MAELTWQKSTYSPDASNCVEIAAAPSVIHVRDSKAPTTQHLTITPGTWALFLLYAAEADGVADA